MNRTAEMLSMRHDKKMSLQSIANFYGISRERVRQIIGNSGNVYLDDARRKISELDMAQLTTSELAEKLGVGFVRASKIISANCPRHAVVEGCNISVGMKAEEIVSEILRNEGFDCALMPIHHPFDILVNGSIKIDVKSAARPSKSPSIRTINPLYRFGVKNGKAADFYIFFMHETNDMFIVPQHVVGKFSDNISFVWPSNRPEIGKYQRYHNRFDLLREF